jgi:hypothetical protein
MGLGPLPTFALSCIIAPVWPRASTFFSKRTSASSHERTIDTVPHYHFPSTLDGSRVSRRDADGAGKFRKAGWRPLNHKLKTTKNVAWAKSLWVRYMIRDDLRQPSSIRVSVTDSITAKVLLSSSSYPNSKKCISGQTDLLHSTKDGYSECSVHQSWRIVICRRAYSGYSDGV